MACTRPRRSEAQAAGAELWRPIGRTVVRGWRSTVCDTTDRRERALSTQSAVVQHPGLESLKPARHPDRTEKGRRTGKPGRGNVSGAEAKPFCRLDLPDQIRAAGLA